MARPYKLKEIANKHGDLSAVIPELVNQHGQGEAARQLGVSQHTISRWLKDNGYIQIRQWVRDSEAQPA